MASRAPHSRAAISSPVVNRCRKPASHLRSDLREARFRNPAGDPIAPRIPEALRMI